MICRHETNDPSCSSHKDYRDYSYTTPEPPAPKKVKEPKTPDAENYDVVDVEQVGNHLVLKVQYPNCNLCAYEGNKVMVFLNTTTKDALRWRKVDPHFRAPTTNKSAVTEAPSPSARFPASQEGWQDALAYAHSKTNGGVRTITPQTFFYSCTCSKCGREHSEASGMCKPCMKLPPDMLGSTTTTTKCPHNNVQQFTEQCLDCGKNIYDPSA